MLVVGRRRLVLLLAAMGCAGRGTSPKPPSPALDRYPIVPAPRHLEPRPGEFRLDRETRILLFVPASTEVRTLSDLLAVPLRAASGLPLPVSSEPAAARATNAILIRLTPDSGSRDPESYRLTVSEKGAILSAATPAGLVLGIQTLRQLLPPELERSSGSAPSPSPAPVHWVIPAVAIDDAPRFRYRGMLLDVARWYYPPEFIEKVIDLLALYKLNTLHLHLTDDQGWRLEIRKYPRLTRIGAWRKETIAGQHFDPYVGDGTPHGGFYTQEEMRHLLAYAAARGVTIMPEIEMPGHAQAALAAYPELSCTGGPFEVSTRWGVHQDIFCPSEQTFAFLEDVLLEVIQLFPSRYIHIGGDEVPKQEWKESPVAQEVIRREGLANEEELQGWFIRRIEAFLRAHGRRLVGWDETLEGGLAPEATVMSWRGEEGGIEAARQGHDVIMTPANRTYLDYYQGDPAAEPLAIGGFLPLDSVYAFEPVPTGLTPAQAAHVLGAQGNLWTEYIPTPARAEYMMLPRMLALAEVLWSPKEARRWDRFVARLPAQFARLDALGAEYRVPEPVGLGEDRLVLEDRIRVTMGSSVPGGMLRYTTDGSEPALSSSRYTGPVVLPLTGSHVTVSARVFLPNGRGSPVARARIARATWTEPVEVLPDTLMPGLTYEYVEGTFRSADEVGRGEPLRVGTVPDAALRGDERPENYGVRLSGLMRVPEDALYTFYLSSDDGAKLRVGGETVADNDGGKGHGQIALRKGFHPIELVFFQATGPAALRLEVSTPESARRPVPADWFDHGAGR
ncbi:MAG: family 20 glycosylhydrolase [Gemmatimonadales bacterium]